MPNKLLLAVAIANMLIWFNIAVYGFFAVYISRAFFPAGDPALALILTFGIFALSFLIRPIGSLVLGAYADKAGRKRSLVLSAMLMSLGTATVALTPSYDTIGVWAPVSMMLARLMQGFAAGGEFGSSTAMLAEATKTTRSWATSWQLASQMLSGALAAAFGAALTTMLNSEQMHSWGWRVPFVFGMIVGPVGLFIRSQLPESKLPENANNSRPTFLLFAHNKARLATAIGFVAVSTGVTYLLTYLPTFAVQALSLPPSIGHLIVMLAFLIQIPLTLLSGALADRIGGVRVMQTATLLLLTTFAPAFWLLSVKSDATTMFILIMWFATIKSLYAGPLAAAIVEVLPLHARATGTALAYNSAVAIFGAAGPLYMTWLGQVIDPKLTPALYMTFLAFISLVALLALRRLPRHHHQTDTKKTDVN